MAKAVYPEPQSRAFIGGCAKQSYGSFSEAQSALQRFFRHRSVYNGHHRTRGFPPNVYRCPYCPGWHWGHDRSRDLGSRP